MKELKLIIIPLLLIIIFGLFFLFFFSKKSDVDNWLTTTRYNNQLLKQYSDVTRDKNIIKSLELLQQIPNETAIYNAILGDNLTKKPIKIQFAHLAYYGKQYKNYDVLTRIELGNQLYIYISDKYKNAPLEALCSLIASRTISQDKYDSINEEIYIWTTEARIWSYFTSKNPSLRNINNTLVKRENLLETFYKKGDNTSKYIKIFIEKHPAYKHMPKSSPGYTD